MNIGDIVIIGSLILYGIATIGISCWLCCSKIEPIAEETTETSHKHKHLKSPIMNYVETPRVSTEFFENNEPEPCTIC